MAHYSWETRLAAYAGFVRGQSAHQIAAKHGLNIRNLTVWARLAGMTFRHGVGGGIIGPEFREQVPDPGHRSYRRLTLADRSFIQAARLVYPPLSFRKIAAELGV